MPHARLRYLEERLKKTLKFSPIVGIVGQRQVGKTTLLAKAGHHYVTLDRESVLREATADPEQFISSRPHPLAIDEAQLCPGLFPALKEAVRSVSKPGQFLLSGSVRFTSRKAIRESLTGRIITLELLPFTAAESHGRQLPDRLAEAQKIKTQSDLERYSEKRGPHCTQKNFSLYLETGGLPGICYFRESHIRQDKFEAQIDTLLHRDIRLVSQTTTSYESLRLLLEHMAKIQGRPFELKMAAEAARVSTVTLKKILPAFEALFLVRPVLSSGPEKRLTYFLEDQGMASWLMGGVLRDSSDICRGLYANLRQEFYYRPERRGRITHFRTKHGVNVPLVFESITGTVGIIPTIERNPSPKTIGSAVAFIKRHPKAKVIIAAAGAEILFRAPQIFQMPFWML